MGYGASVGSRPIEIPWGTPLALGSKLKLLRDETGQTIATGINSWANASVPATAAFAQATGSAQPSQVTFAGFPSASFNPAGLQFLASSSAISTFLSTTEEQGFGVIKFPAIAPTSSNPRLQASFLSDTGGFWGISARDNSGTYEVTYFIDSGGVVKQIVLPGVQLDTLLYLEWGRYNGSLMFRRDAQAAPPIIFCGATTTTGLAQIGTNFNQSVYSRLVAGEFFVTTHLTAAEVQSARLYFQRKHGCTVRPPQSLGRVVACGDSITIGYNNLTGGWRLDTESILNMLGIACTWVGPYTIGGGNHRGVSGEKASGVTDLVSVLTTYQADCAILAWGTNDIGNGDGPSATLTAIQARIVDALTAGVRPNRIFVQSVVRATSGPYSAFGADYVTVNAALPSICTTFGVNFVDIDTPTTTDGVHPADGVTGYQVMTQRQAEGMHVVVDV